MKSIDDLLIGGCFILTMSVFCLVILLAVQEETGLDIAQIYATSPPF